MENRQLGTFAQTTHQMSHKMDGFQKHLLLPSHLWNKGENSSGFHCWFHSLLEEKINSIRNLKEQTYTEENKEENSQIQSNAKRIKSS